MARNLPKLPDNDFERLMVPSPNITNLGDDEASKVVEALNTLFSQDTEAENEIHTKNPISLLKFKRRTYMITLVTPLFGGGVEAGENDLNMLIRASSIRGHLRFWWRAIRGTQYESVKDMRDAEAKIWGSISQSDSNQSSQSQVGIKVITQPAQKTQRRHDYMNPQQRPEPFEFNAFGPEAYALFPAKETQTQQGKNILKEGGSFTIEITYPKKWTPKEFETNVESAIWAWVNFGGIGARTRRGCGALFCIKFAPPDANGIERWFRESLEKYGIQKTSSLRDWPLFFDSLYILRQEQEQMKAWKDVLSVYQSFRQGKNFARNPGQPANRPGRSRWPEPETVRNLTRRRDNRHPRTEEFQQHPQAFPRAEFGLPILFHFKDRNDPGDTTLVPALLHSSEKIERMGSPLIVKPLVLKNGQAVACVARLKTKSIEKVHLTQAGCDNREFPVQSTQLQYANSPLKGRSASGSAIEGFLNYLTQDKKFIEVPQ